MNPALLALLLAPAQAQQAPAEGGLDVLVFDADGRPVAGAQVTAGGRTATTDADGYAHLDLPPGEVPVQVGHGAGTRRLDAVAIFAGEASELLVTLLPPDRAETAVEAPDPATAAAARAGPSGTVEGTVRDEAGAPLAGARVYARGQAATATTDARGRFTLDLPAGTHDLSVIRAGYAAADLPAVAVAPDAPASVEVAMVEAAATLTYEVTAPRIEGGTASLLEERQESTQVAEVLGAEEMSRSGDSTAASALRRVTGLTLVDGKFVYVRGMGGRYNSTLMNGAALPSTQPEQRVVPLDLFPTSVLDSIVVQKSFSPDMPAEFGGGTIQLRTRRVPQELVAKVEVSGAYTTGSTGQAGPWGATGGGLDWLGHDDGTRALPAVVAEASADQALAEGDMFNESGYTAEELEALGEAMPNHWALTERKAPIDRGAKAVLGYGGALGEDVRVGALVGANHGSDWDYDEYDRTYYLVGAGGALEEQHAYRFRTLTNEVVSGGIGLLGVELTDHHSVGYTSILVRSTDNEARIYQGYNRDVGGDIQVARTRFVERQLWYNQLAGEHTFPFLHLPGADGVELDWRYSWSKADRDEPDRREWRKDYEESTGQWLLSDRPEGNQIVYSVLDDHTSDLGGDLTVPFPFLWQRQGRLKGGLVLMDKDRVVDTRRYKYINKGTLSDEVSALPVDQIFTAEHIGPGQLQFEEITRSTDNYTASQRIRAFYGMAELPLSPSTTAAGGVRSEASRQVVETFELFNPDNEPVVARLDTTDLLPAATITQDLPHQMQVRVGYGRTISRPDFREMSPATFNDVTGGRQIRGNEELVRALIDNVDLRWEWYPQPGEAFSVGAFYKRLQDPIEVVVENGGQITETWDNADSATNVGLEADWRKGFGFVSPDLEPLYLAGNVALIRSRVELGEAGAGSRPLEGQSPYVLNLQVGWDDVERGTRVALLYNAFGRRLSGVGLNEAPDYYQLDVHTVDLVASQDLPWGLGVGLKAGNLLDDAQVEVQGDSMMESQQHGRSFSLSLSWEG